MQPSGSQLAPTRCPSVSHLHSETETLPVADSLSLLCSQFLAIYLRPHHPSHPDVRHSGPRSMKQTLQSHFLPSVSPHLMEGVLPPQSYRQTLPSLHTAAVRQAIALGRPKPSPTGPSTRIVSLGEVSR